MQKLLIYTPKITPRIEYLFDFILNEFLGLEYELTTNIQFFEASDAPRINFSEEKYQGSVRLLPDAFLFEKGISSDVEFDKLNEAGKCFYALSRYEEYLPFEGDKHGRFSGVGKVYETPFVDTWILEFAKELKQSFPELEFKKREFKITLSCDVDQAWKYKLKGMKRTVGACLRDLARLDFKEVKERRSRVFGEKKDPFDTYDLFKNLKEKHEAEIIFFWLMADYGEFDKNNPVDNEAFQNKILEIAQWAECGIHPSYASNKNPEKLKTEIGRLSKVLEKPVTKSRQHYIILKFPETYRNLISNGITDDYTMAYADVTGFRAGTCTSFFWYDLEKEEKTDLKVHPFCAMDVSMKRYMNLSKEEAIKELARLKKEIQKVEGQMTVLFHNSNFHDSWEGWDKVMESLF